MNKKDLLLTKLMEYSNSDYYPMHMPGHKRNRDFPNPFSIDITEIDGFDNLHHPEEILKDSMEWAARVYGADKSYYLVNGSSCGILSAVSAATANGGKILISRNCHKSVYHGIILKQLKTEYVYPQIIMELGIQGGILPEDVEKALKKNPDIQAVLVVSPTYDGVVSDIQGIADMVHQRGIPLIVDEAHGAHFPFGRNDFPVSALQMGADVVIQSLHKTLPSLTQTAILHVRTGRISLEKLEYYLQIYQSSSPSYVFMASMESCIFEMEQHGRERLHELRKHLDAVRERLRELQCLRIFDCKRGAYGVFDLDAAKIVISCRGCQIAELGKCMDGGMLSDMLRERYHIEMEMSGADYATAITSCFDRAEGLERLCEALLDIDRGLKRTAEKTSLKRRWRFPDIRMKMSDAADAEYEVLPLEDCVGRISAEFIYLYPPGIPITAPGEIVTDEILNEILEYKKMGLPVQGMADKKAEHLRVINEER